MGVAAVLLSVASVVLGVAVVSVVSLGVAAAPAVLASAGSGWMVSAGVVVLLVAAFAAGAFVLAPPSALPASLVVVSGCACRSAVA